MKKRKGSRSVGQEIHPPHQHGKRADPQQLAIAITNASRDPASAALVRREHGYAIEKRQFVRYNPGVLPDEEARDASAAATVADTSKSLEEAQLFQIRSTTHLKMVAKLPRREPIKAEIARFLDINPNATAKLVERELRKRIGQAESPITGYSTRGIEWTNNGRTRVTSLHGISRCMTEIRKKSRD